MKNNCMIMVKKSFSLLNSLLFMKAITTQLRAVQSIIHCPVEEGGGVCPDGSMCCKIVGTDGHSFSSGCVASNPHIDGNGTCCGDFIRPGLGSACAGNYKCDFEMSSKSPLFVGDRADDDGGNNSSFFLDHFCSLETLDEDGKIKSISRMPRYALIESSTTQLKMRGFPIFLNHHNSTSILSTSTSHIDSVKRTAAKERERIPAIAYYSNMEQWGLTTSGDGRIKIVVIVIHGSGRDADKYNYALIAATEIQEEYSPENVLVIAPRFLGPEDGVNYIPVKMGKRMQMLPTLMWNETDPIPHTWRYGANALPPFSSISSYDVMDALVEHFALNAGEGRRYANLEKIVAIGHSAGGQFTHRWGLTSNSPAWGDVEAFDSANVDFDANYRRKDSSVEKSGVRDSVKVPVQKRRQRRSLKVKEKRGNKNMAYKPSLRAVAANPRSFCYLDSRRFINGKFQIPPASLVQKCPNYNKWEWGLENGGELPTPYKDRAVNFFGGDLSKLIHRYSKRDVVYLAGNNDTQHLHSECEDDDFQGTFRRERSENFYSSLKHIFGSKVHSRFVVDDVGHDHSLMFTSREGIEAIFGA